MRGQIVTACNRLPNWDRITFFFSFFYFFWLESEFEIAFLIRQLHSDVAGFGVTVKVDGIRLTCSQQVI